MGKLGEEAAAAYLRQNGFRILARNWSTRLGEIDIIAKKNQTFVFVEVRTTRGIRYGDGFQSVNRRKQQKVRRVALQYIQRQQLGDRPVRFDVISVRIDCNNQVQQLDHIPHAF